MSLADFIHRFCLRGFPRSDAFSPASPANATLVFRKSCERSSLSRRSRVNFRVPRRFLALLLSLGSFERFPAVLSFLLRGLSTTPRAFVPNNSFTGFADFYVVYFVLWNPYYEYSIVRHVMRAVLIIPKFPLNHPALFCVDPRSRNGNFGTPEPRNEQPRPGKG